MWEQLRAHLARIQPNREQLLSVWIHSAGIAGRLNPEGRPLQDADITTSVAVAEAALRLLPPNSPIRQSIQTYCKARLENSTANGPPWDTFHHGDELAAIFTTGRVLLDLGKHVSAFIADDLLTRATESLRSWISTQDLQSQPIYLPFVFRAALALDRISALDRGTKSLVGKQVQALIHRYVSFHTLGSQSRFDPTILCLSVVADAHFSINPLTQRERENCLKIAFTQYEPLVTVCTGTITRAGTDAVGCSGVEVLFRLLETEPLWSILCDHEEQLIATLAWLEDHSSVVHVSGNNSVRLYQSDVFPDYATYDAWFNALVLQFFAAVERFLSSTEQERVKRTYRASKPESKLDYGSIICGGYRWPKLLRDRFLAKVAAEGLDPAITGNGIILFGPPGTGKTSLAKVIAHQLQGWDFIKLSTVDFLMDGYPNLFRTIRKIFEDLKTLSRCVVFFDELELLVLDREREKADWTTGVITNVMLPELQELHDCKNVLPIFATNHISKFDTAGRRPGRFDYILPVGLPSSDERKRLIESKVPLSLRFDGIEEISKGASLLEVLDWAKEYATLGCAGYQPAKNLWEQRFTQLRVESGTLERFKDDIKKFSYPAGVE